ncbi:MAG: phosphate ABC transporter permease PstA [Spirochaetales bacterium]
MSELFVRDNDQVDFAPNVAGRKARAGLWNVIFLAATLVGVLSLVALVTSLLDSCFGYVIVQDAYAWADVATDPTKKLEDLSQTELVTLIRSTAEADLTDLTLGRLKFLEMDRTLEVRTSEDLRSLVRKEILKSEIKKSWSLTESLLQANEIANLQKSKYPEGQLAFRSWLTPNFLTQPQTGGKAETNGLRGAIIGSMWIILIAIVVAFPIGIGSAIYLEEYATNNWLNRLIQTNIYNLAGVPSIIYGMLGLAVFVRLAEPLTSGSLFGVQDVNGRTVFSAGLTLGILILPIIIINAQEALKAIPNSLRYSSYGVGATKWQTVWHHVIPASLDRILTGTVFGISRAIGETAPLVVIGASAFLTLDPSGLFSKFTALPIQIFTWSQMAVPEFKHTAAAAIIVLLVLLLGLNTVAIIFRNRIKQSKDAL